MNEHNVNDSICADQRDPKEHFGAILSFLSMQRTKRTQQSLAWLIAQTYIGPAGQGHPQASLEAGLWTAGKQSAEEDRHTALSDLGQPASFSNAYH